MKLSASTLKALPRRISVPEYKRTGAPRIVHFGVGNFCRAHLFQNTHRCNQTQADDPWLVHGIGILDNDCEMHAWEKLKSSDFLYGLMLLPSKDTEIIGTLAEYDWIPHSAAAYQNALKAISAPHTQIISLTITEKGYCTDIEGQLDFTIPDLKHDAELLSRPDGPLGGGVRLKTSLGMLTMGLHNRQSHAPSDPVTLLSCDNLPSNGAELKRLLLDFISQTKPQLLDYVEHQVSFPNSMVDRITPGVTDESVALFQEETGIADPWPIIAEDFSQWVVEDDFIAGRPAWDSVEGNNILFVQDCEPYEHMKLRLLNASHTAMAYLSILAGHTKVNESMRRENVFQYVKSYMDMATATVPHVQGVCVEEYKNTLQSRFCNLSDDLSRLAQDGSKKMVGFVLPSLKIQLASGNSTEQIASVVASWIYYLHCMPNEVDDPRRDELLHLSKAVMDGSPAAMQEFVKRTLGEDIESESNFIREIEIYLKILESQSADAVLNAFMDTKTAT